MVHAPLGSVSRRRRHLAAVALENLPELPQQSADDVQKPAASTAQTHPADSDDARWPFSLILVAERRCVGTQSRMERASELQKTAPQIPP